MFSNCFKNGVFKPTEDWIDKPTEGRVLCGFREVFFDGFQKGAKNPTVVRQATRPWLGYLSDRGRVKNTAK